MRDFRSTRYAAQSHKQRRVFVALIESQNGDVDHGDDPHSADSLIEDRPQLNAQSCWEARAGRCQATPSATWICIVREGAFCRSSHLAVPSLCAVRSANCSWLHPVLCTSFFGDRSDRSGGHPCPRTVPPLKSVPRVPHVFAPLLSRYPCGVPARTTQ